MLFPSRARIIHSAYSAVGALVFSLYLIYDTQMMLGGNHKNSISPEDYIFAALSIYLDIMQLFLHILRLISSSEEWIKPLHPATIYTTDGVDYISHVIFLCVCVSKHNWL